MTRTIFWTDNVTPLRRLTPLEPRAYEVTDDLPPDPPHLPRCGLLTVVTLGVVSWLSVIAATNFILSLLKWLVW